MPKAFYITTTLPYVNADLHIGHALEFVRADAIARYKRLAGYEVFFNTGTDEHGLKIYRKAKEEGKDPQAYVNDYAKRVMKLKDVLNLSYTNFIRTTDNHHELSAQELWKICAKNGFIYKKNYQIKYCVGCELEKTESELVEGRCPIHPNLEIELIDEENYFFKFSAFQKPLLELYKKPVRTDHPGGNPNFVVPDFRFNEIKAFVERGLEDFSISRLKSKMPWGVGVPGDPQQVMYVWFDALTNYISALGWPEDMKAFEKFWKNGTPTQYCGKDNLRQQSAIWQAMLMAAKLPQTKQIIINGFINIDGQKISKSLGNVILPSDIVKDYSTDALRYYYLREVNNFEDSDFSMVKFKETYNANLANGLGNLTSRIMKMAETNLPKDRPLEFLKDGPLPEELTSALGKFEINKAMDFIWAQISKLDETIQKEEPFKLVKSDPEKGKKIIKNLVVELYNIAKYLEPFLPETAAKIQAAIKANKIPAPLFLRKD